MRFSHVIPSEARNLTSRLRGQSLYRFARFLVALLLGMTGLAHAQGGNGTLYIGTYGRQVLVMDEATMKVKDSIKTSIGVPRLSLSFDRKHIYVSDPGYEKVEIIDVASKKPLGNFTLSHDSVTVRFRGYNLDPKERFMVIVAKIYTKLPDRFQVSEPTILKYDLATHRVTDTIPWPKGEVREGAQIVFSPAGDLMYFFTTDDVLVYDAVTLKEVDRWDISKTLYEEGL